MKHKIINFFQNVKSTKNPTGEQQGTLGQPAVLPPFGARKTGKTIRGRGDDLRAVPAHPEVPAPAQQAGLQQLLRGDGEQAAGEDTERAAGEAAQGGPRETSLAG